VAAPARDRLYVVRSRCAGARNFPGLYLQRIALNAAVSARYAVGGDRAKVRLLAEELEPLWGGWLAGDAELREATAELADTSPIYDEPPGEGRSSQVAVSADGAMSVLVGVYAVRNNLFHGSKRCGDLRDHRLVRLANQIVRRVLINSGLLDSARQGGNLEEPPCARRSGAGSDVADGEYRASFLPRPMPRCGVRPRTVSAYYNSRPMPRSSSANRRSSRSFIRSSWRPRAASIRARSSMEATDGRTPRPSGSRVAALRRSS
jgi:hypothetical protein